MYIIYIISLPQPTSTVQPSQLPSAICTTLPVRRVFSRVFFGEIFAGVA